jgi:hypothetical protein
MSRQTGNETKSPQVDTSRIASPRTWDSCAALSQAEVPLVELAEGLCLDDRCGEPIRFLADRGLLAYRGRMSHASFVHLQGLSRDRRYHRALEALFVATSMTAAPPAGRHFGWWAAGVAAALLVGALLGWRGFGASRELEALQEDRVAARSPSTESLPPHAVQSPGVTAAETRPAGSER